MIKPWYGPTIASLLLYGLWGYWGAKTSSEVGARAANFYSAFGTFIIGMVCLAMMHFKPSFTLKGASFGLLTGASTGLGTLFFIQALRKGPAIPVVMITALYPLVTTFLLVIFYHQTLTIKQMLGVTLSLIALILLA
jgi:bacterial/archaeal transporter family protein